MTRHTFAYVVQLDLPNRPIKIGHSANLLARFECFNNATPVAARLIGATIGGRAREIEFLDATSDKILKGEWRLPTGRLQTLLNEAYLRGEWFVRQPDIASVWQRHDVLAKIAEADPRCAARIRKPVASCIQYYDARRSIQTLASAYPLLGLHMIGFDVAHSAPSLVWPEQAAA